LFSVTLSVTSSFRLRPPRVLRGMLPCGVRTFLQPAGVSPDAPAIVRRPQGDSTRLAGWRQPPQCLSGVELAMLPPAYPVAGPLRGVADGAEPMPQEERFDHLLMRGHGEVVMPADDPSCGVVFC